MDHALYRTRRELQPQPGPGHLRIEHDFATLHAGATLPRRDRPLPVAGLEREGRPLRRRGRPVQCASAIGVIGGNNGGPDGSALYDLGIYVFAGARVTY